MACSPTHLFRSLVALTLASMSLADTTSPPPPDKIAVNAKSVYDAVSELVFPVVTAVDATSPKASYGSGFVVTRGGVLITNYHVVAEVVNRPKTYHLYVMLKNHAVEAKILAIDVIHDLAAIKVSETFQNTVPISQAELSTGQKLFSIGQPEDLNMSVIEGNFNGLLQQGPYEQIVLSSPINPGMSGGPTLNEKGEVSGVNVALLSGAQNISFAVPSHFIVEMCKNAASGRSSASADDWNSQILKNLTTAETTLTETWLKNDSEKSVFHGWKTLAPPPGLKCWRDSEEKGKILPPQASIEFQICRSNFETRPAHNISTSNFELSFLNVSKLSGNSAEFFETINALYPIASSAIMGKFSAHSASSSHTGQDCSERIVVNHKNVSMKVSYCASAYVKYAGINDTVVKFATLTPGSDGLIVVLRLNGFTTEHTQKIIDSLLESVEKG